MPFAGLLKTTIMPDTYAEVRYVNFSLQDRSIQFNIGVWADDTKMQYLTDITYVVNQSDPLWDTYFEIFCPKNDLTDAIDDYLETKAEFGDCVKS